MKIKAFYNKLKSGASKAFLTLGASLISTAIYASEEGNIGYDAAEQTGLFFTNLVMGVCFALLIPVTMVQVASFQAGNKSAMEAARWPLVLTVLAIIPKLGEVLLPSLKALAGF